MRSKNTLVMVVLLWCVFMALLIVVGGRYWRNSNASTERGSKDSLRSATSYLDEKLLKENLSTVYQVFAAHVVAADNAQRAQMIADPIRVTPKLMRYFELNPLIRLNPENMTPRSSEVLRVPEGEAIEVLWTSEDNTYDTVFFRRDGEWRLDWEHFARYSDFPLSLFLAGSGPDEAEFRLFARQRLAAERKNKQEISVVLYSTVAGRPSEVVVQTPEFLVPRDLPVGQRLLSAFQQAKEGKRPFDSRLAVEDPDDLVRVRVRIRRKEVDGKRSFEIIDVPACHWYGITNAPGVPEEVAEDPAVDKTDVGTP